ncbi:MAG: c-type cytochrome [Magnetospirillum sp.]|nr:c-type cytochrome [Magnetospirillum sp.]
MPSSWTLAAAAVTALAITATPALAADGKALFADKGCTACHGENARTPIQAGYPVLAGQNAAYVLQQLKDIKSGARANGQIPDTMKPVVADIAESDLGALADYLGTLGRFADVTAHGPADSPGRQLYLTKTCIACHGKEGNKPVMANYPYLAGQDKAYLLQQMKDIKAGLRKNGSVAAMQPVMHLVSEPEMEAIADYLSNVK